MSWPEVPLRRIFRIVNGGTPKSDEQYWDGDVPWATPVDIGSVDGKCLASTQRSLTEEGVLAGSRTVPGESLVLSTRAPIGYVAQTAGKMAFNQGCRGLVATVPADMRYFRYQLHALRDELAARGAGSTFMELSTDALATVRMMNPPLGEQRRIADFLDAETARIDALITSRLAQTSVLGELELARIGEHLSGIDLGTSRTETAWPWLPLIPDGWSIGPVYAYFDVQLGKMLNAERASGEGQQPYLRNANIHWYEISTDDLATMMFEPYEQIRYGVLAGDLMVCEGGAGIAEAAVWDGRTATCFYQKSLHRVRAASHVPVEWLMYWLRFAKAAGVFDADGNLATIPHLTGEQLAEYRSYSRRRPWSSSRARL